jgi:hypothetical protein
LMSAPKIKIGTQIARRSIKLLHRQEGGSEASLRRSSISDRG